MWSDVAEIAIDVFNPGLGGSGLDYDRLFDKKNQLRVPLAISGAFKERLNASGWFEEEIVAAGIVNQGKAQSLFSMFTGWVDHQVALLRRGRRRLSVAILITSSPSHAYGNETLRGVAARLLRGLGPRSRPR